MFFSCFCVRGRINVLKRTSPTLTTRHWSAFLHCSKNRRGRWRTIKGDSALLRFLSCARKPRESDRCNGMQTHCKVLFTYFYDFVALHSMRIIFLKGLCVLVRVGIIHKSKSLPGTVEKNSSTIRSSGRNRTYAFRHGLIVLTTIASIATMSG